MAHLQRWAILQIVKKSIVIAFLFIVTMPLILISWLGWRSIKGEQERFQERLTELQMERLTAFAENQLHWINTFQSTLIRDLENLDDLGYQEWRDVQNQNRFVYQFFEAANEETLHWPNSDITPLSADESAFVELFEAGNITFTPPSDSSLKSDPDFGWATWFEGPGQQWAFWIRNKNNLKVSMVLDRSALISEAIAQLPSTTDRTENETFVLLNEAGSILYRWGNTRNESILDSQQETHLPAPFNMWRIQFLTSNIQTPPWHKQPLILGMVGSIATLSLLILAVALYLFSETRREFAQARQRVSFVNQVSHELKTPLTNIQLYSELLEDSVEGGAENKHLNVILEETGKLSRMIQNVLTFARNQRTALQLHPRPISPDKCLYGQLELHKPSLQRQNIKLDLHLSTQTTVKIDPDVLAQIFSNLISNVEKYAPNSTVSIHSRQFDDLLEVCVHDKGPGIPLKKHEKVFEQFVRLEDKTNEGVSGTGIGLPIARDLARLHGGDLILIPSETGAKFAFTLKEK